MKMTIDPTTRHKALRASGTLNPHPERVIDALFCAGVHELNPFFDAHDLVQVKYEMLRRVRVEHMAVRAAAAAFGLSRVTWYHVQDRYAAGGMIGLLPQARGPKPQTKAKKRCSLPEMQVPDVRTSISISRPNSSSSMRCCVSKF